MILRGKNARYKMIRAVRSQLYRKYKWRKKRSNIPKYANSGHQSLCFGHG